jgi:hypothetical protein
LLTPIGTLRFYLQRTFFGDQAIAVRRELFERAGGYREPELMEDVDLSHRLRREGKLLLLPAHVTTSARRFERSGVLRSLLMMSSLQVAYSLGIPSERLTRWYAHVREMPDSEQLTPPAVDLLSLRLRDWHNAEKSFSDFAGQPALLVYLRWLG